MSVAGDRALLQQHIVRLAEGEHRGKWQCSICGKVNGQKIHTENHIESIHFPGTFEHKCKYCGLSFAGRNMMYMHINKTHKGQEY